MLIYWGSLKQYDKYLLIQITQEESFHSSTNMPDVKSVVVKSKNYWGQQLSFELFGCYTQSMLSKNWFNNLAQGVLSWPENYEQDYWNEQ